MAGIGFELRKLLDRDSYTGLLQAYAYASIISSGPWVLSILGILIIGVMSASVVVPNYMITQFQTSVTYLIACSLIATGPIQLAFTRFTADRLYEKQEDRVLPNFNGVLLVVTCVCGLGGLAFAAFALQGLNNLYRLLMLTGFVLLSNIWVATIFLSGLKQYRAIVALYALGYGITVASALVLRPLGLEGLLLGFVLGQGVLLLGMVLIVLRAYPASEFIAFEFARPGAMFPTIMAVGLAYNLAIWLDKFMFWYADGTGRTVIGPLHASVIYDLPVFLAYLSILPGMAVFLVRMETDFVEYYQRFFDAVREGATLEYLEELRNEMVLTVRRGLFEIIKIQSIAALVVFIAGPKLLEWAGIPQLYLPLLYIDVVAAGLQVVLLGLLNVFFYLDKRRTVLGVTLLFLVLNGLFTWATLHLGVTWFGYGFAIALLVTVVAGFAALDRKLESLEYETFMLQ
ncbi:MAG TPA: exopolysaccharide Pel transporter PelG [Burkholderiales bacterium]|nr:exopolysaccharide Pel transporter PelG [Burkholderiales bacterium]